MAKNNRINGNYKRTLIRASVGTFLSIAAAVGSIVCTQSTAFAHRAGPLHRTPVVIVVGADDFSDVSLTGSAVTSGYPRAPREAKTRRARVSYLIHSERD